MLCEPLGICNSTKSKTLTMLMGLRELKKMDIVGCIIEGGFNSGYWLGARQGMSILEYVELGL